MRDYGISKDASAQAPVVSAHPPIFDKLTLASNGTTVVALLAGTVLGRITASGKYVPVAPAASDGSQTAARILAETVAVPATGDETALAFKHGAFTTESLGFGTLTAGQIATAVGQLEAVGLYVIPAAV